MTLAETSPFCMGERAMASIFWAHTHVGHDTGEFFADFDSWEEAGFSEDDNGNPVTDCRGNTVAKFSREDFDPSNSDHVKLACEYATADGCTDRDTLEDYLIGELGVTPADFELNLGEWIADADD